jgi:hypothetical protein
MLLVLLLYYWYIILYNIYIKARIRDHVNSCAYLSSIRPASLDNKLYDLSVGVLSHLFPTVVMSTSADCLALSC